jgi:hypothetical protein
MRTIALIGVLVLGSLLMPPPTDAQWDKLPIITLSAPEQDPRIPLALEAVVFWNRQLTEIGTSFDAHVWPAGPLPPGCVPV